MKATVKVLAARKFTSSKTGKDYFINVVEMAQDDVATVSTQYRSFEQDKALEPGTYTVDVRFYARDTVNSKGFKDKVIVASFSNYQKQ